MSLVLCWINLCLLKVSPAYNCPPCHTCSRMGLSVLSCGGLSGGARYCLAGLVGWFLETLLGLTRDENVQSKILLPISFASYNNLDMQEPSEPVFKPMVPTHWPPSLIFGLLCSSPCSVFPPALQPWPQPPWHGTSLGSGDIRGTDRPRADHQHRKQFESLCLRLRKASHDHTSCLLLYSALGHKPDS